MAVNVTANFHNHHHTHNNNQHPHPHLDKVDDLEHELEHHGGIHVAAGGSDKVTAEHFVGGLGFCCGGMEATRWLR